MSRSPRARGSRATTSALGVAAAIALLSILVAVLVSALARRRRSPRGMGSAVAMAGGTIMWLAAAPGRPWRRVRRATWLLGLLPYRSIARRVWIAATTPKGHDGMVEEQLRRALRGVCEQGSAAFHPDGR